MKKTAAVLAALLLCILAAACRSTDDVPGANAGSSDPAPEAGENRPAGAENWPLIRMEVCSYSGDETLEPEVENTLNRYLASIDAGVQADLVPIAITDRPTSLALMLSGTENRIDLYNWRWYSTVRGLVESNQCISLEKYRSIYPELWELFPEAVYDTCKVNGEQYSLPSADSFGTFQVYALRKDIADELGISSLDRKKISMDDLERYLLSAEELHPELCYQGSMWLEPLQNIDTFGDSHALGVLPDRGTSGTRVINYYGSGAFEEYCRMCHDFAEKGLFRDDPLNNSLTGAPMVNEGLCGGFLFEAYSCDYANSLMEAQCPGIPMVIFQITSPGCDNACVYGGWQISALCRNPDAAMKLLYLSYTDETVARLLAMGIEGRTYEVDENGCAWYPEGTDASNCGWNMSAPWFYPNECLCLPFETENAAYYTGMKDFWQNPEVQYSRALGFVFDTKPVFEEYAACSAIIDEYRPALMCGQVDVDAYLLRMNEELQNNGIDRIISEMQRQLDSFLASKS